MNFFLAGIWHILSLAYKNSTSIEPPKGVTLANQSLLLILVLVNHCTAEKNLRNPYREFLFTFINSSQGKYLKDIIFDVLAYIHFDFFSQVTTN